METIGEKAEGKSLTRSVTKKSTQKRRITNCESCMNYEYDEEYGIMCAAKIWMRMRCIGLSGESSGIVHIISLETSTRL